MPAPPRYPTLQNGNFGLDGRPDMTDARSSRGAARERQHATEDSTADLERALQLSQVLLPHGGIGRSLLEVLLHLLNQRKHRAERVVHVVRYASREIGHRVFSFSGEHSRLKGLGPIQDVDGN